MALLALIYMINFIKSIIIIYLIPTQKKTIENIAIETRSTSDISDS